MRALLVTVATVTLLAVGGWFLLQRGPGDETSDRKADVISLALENHPEADAMGYARDIIGSHNGAVVLTATDGKTSDLRAHIVIQLSYAKPREGLSFGSEPVTMLPVCYALDIARFGVNKKVVDCPANAPVTPPPVPSTDIPAGDADAVPAILTALPQSPTDAQVTAALAGLPKPAVDPETKLVGVAPRVQSAVHGSDVAMAIRGGDYYAGYQCVFGLRQGGKVLVWRPASVELKPGELTCQPGEAFARDGLTPPH